MFFKMAGLHDGSIKTSLALAEFQYGGLKPFVLKTINRRGLTLALSLVEHQMGTQFWRLSPCFRSCAISSFARCNPRQKSKIVPGKQSIYLFMLPDLITMQFQQLCLGFRGQTVQRDQWHWCTIDPRGTGSGLSKMANSKLDLLISQLPD